LIKKKGLISTKEIAVSFSLEDPRKVYRKCNDMLFNENYLDRLFQRYKFSLNRNEEINKKVQDKFERNFENRNKIIENFNTMEPSFISHQIYQFGESKYFRRLENRLEDYHKKKFVACWNKNKLPQLDKGKN
jgi:hypothetical protein